MTADRPLVYVVTYTYHSEKMAMHYVVNETHRTELEAITAASDMHHAAWFPLGDYDLRMVRMPKPEAPPHVDGLDNITFWDVV